MDHLAIAVRDQERPRRFYEPDFGFGAQPPYARGVVGVAACVFWVCVTFGSPWTPLFSVGDWRRWLAMLVGVSALAAIAIYSISQFAHRRRLPVPSGSTPSATPAT